MKTALLILIGIAAGEMYLLFFMAERAGSEFTLIWVLLTAFLGYTFAKIESARTINRIKTQVETLSVPTDELLDTPLIVIAGVLLVVPGVITDVIGTLILFPLTRGIVRGVIKNSVINRLKSQTWFQSIYPGGEMHESPESDSTIDAEFQIMDADLPTASDDASLLESEDNQSTEVD